MPQSQDIQFTRACGTVIVTAERIVDTEEIRRHAHLTEVPAFRTTCVVEAPWGAHPCPVLGVSGPDDAHMAEYIGSSHSDEGFRAYLEAYVFGVPDQRAYLERVGLERLMALQTHEAVA